MRLNRLATILRMITVPGPIVGSANANAIVAQLREGRGWASQKLQELVETDKNRAAEQIKNVHLEQALIVDRWGLIDAICADIESESVPSYHMVIDIARQVSSLQSYWSKTLGRLLLVAPNILVSATRSGFDQGDFAKWVPLQGGLMAVYGLTYADDLAAPGIVEECTEQALRRLEPKDLTSIYWLRQHLSVVPPSLEIRPTGNKDTSMFARKV